LIYPIGTSFIIQQSVVSLFSYQLSVTSYQLSVGLWFFVTRDGSIGGHKSTKSLSGKRLN